VALEGVQLKGLAAFVMRGRAQALLVALGAAATMWVLPPLNVFLGGVIALVTLRRGLLEGVILTVALFVAGAGLAALAMTNAQAAWSFVAMLFLTVVPALGLAAVLRRTISLPITVVTAAAVAAALVVGVHVVIGDTVAWWRQVLTVAMEPGVAAVSGNVDPESVARFMDTLAGWVTGMLAAALVFGTLLSLFLGRWWQALLYNPGGFQQEFYELRLGRTLGMVTAVTIAAAVLLPGVGGQMAQDLLWVAGATYLLPGLSIVHVWLSGSSKVAGGLVLVYVLLGLIPHTAVVLALLGWADTWLDVRSRLRRRVGS
jgi:hypothetical protein